MSKPAIFTRVASLVRHRRMPSAPVFFCPICLYRGQFIDLQTKLGVRKYAKCPRCESLERHRLQKLVFELVMRGRDITSLSVLHFAPEPFMRPMFGGVREYVTADLCMPGADYHFDLQSEAPFTEGSFDLVYASHVLEHIKDDRTALRQVCRVLKPGGLAILPVPIVVEITIEYPEPNSLEDYHVRAPGLDYYGRYSEVFSRVETYGSHQFDAQHQLYIHEDRSIYPTSESPLRTPSFGDRHIDIVPVCFKA